MQRSGSSERELWMQVESLSLKLATLAVKCRQQERASEESKKEAAEVVDALCSCLPSPASFEVEQLPAILMDLKNARAAPVVFSTPARFSSRRELVERFADEPKVSVPVAPPMFSASGEVPVPERAPALNILMCSFCGTQNSPEWRKGPNGKEENAFFGVLFAQKNIF